MDSRPGLFLVMALCLGASAARAQGTAAVQRFYAGADFGQSTLDAEDTFAGATEVVDHSKTWSLRVGYRFSRFFALEAGYSDIGEFRATYVPVCPINSVCSPSRTQAEIDGFLVNAIGIWPVAEYLELKGSLGMTYRDFKSTAIYENATNRWSDTDTVFSFGIGMAIPVSDRFNIDLDFTHYREIGLGLTLGSELGVINEAETSLATVGVRYRF